MADVRSLLAAATQRLGARVEAEVLLLHLLERPRSWLFAHADEVPATDVQTAYAALVERRACGEPVAYLTGRRGFWSIELEVTPDTLIPRADTERLVELALQHLPEGAACTIADLGTGSGAIALALASERPRAWIVATDASDAALLVAQRNAQRLGVANVEFLQGDWLLPLAGRSFDVIVSNPPYIEADDAHLGQGDLRFEPITALASGKDGLDAIRRIVSEAREHLNSGGWLLFEHGWHQGEAARQLLRQAGYDDVLTVQDMEQRDRVSGGRLLPV